MAPNSAAQWVVSSVVSLAAWKAVRRGDLKAVSTAAKMAMMWVARWADMLVGTKVVKKAVLWAG